MTISGERSRVEQDGHRHGRLRDEIYRAGLSGSRCPEGLSRVGLSSPTGDRDPRVDELQLLADHARGRRVGGPARRGRVMSAGASVDKSTSPGVGDDGRGKGGERGNPTNLPHSSASTAARSSSRCAALIGVAPAAGVASVQPGTARPAAA